MLRRRLRAILFEQRDAPFRLALTRVLLAAAILRLVAKLPPGSFFEEHRDTLMAPEVRRSRFPDLDARQFDLLRRATQASVAAWSLTGRPRPLGWSASAAFFVLNGYLAAVYPQLWSYNSHLNLFLATAATADTTAALTLQDPLGRRARRRRVDEVELRSQSLALAFMQLATSLVYFQSGMSKVIYGRGEWVRSGRTLRGSVAILGTRLGRRFMRSRRAFVLLSWATVLFEVGHLPALVLAWRRRRLLALGAVGFHAGVKAFMDISFWHLWWLYPALFVAPAPSVPRSRRLRFLPRRERRR
jgi:hypothetical protein